MPHSALHRLADSYLPRFRDTFLASVERLRERVTTDMVAEDMRAPDDPHRLFELIDSMTIAKAIAPPEDKVFAELITDAARLAVGARSLRQAFTIESPFVKEAARRFSGQLISEVTGAQKAAVRQIITFGVSSPSDETEQAPSDPVGMAQRIKQVIGLTERDATAVRSFAANQRSQATTARQFEMAERRIERFSQKLLRNRALNIARTETIRAFNAGQVMGWQEMADQGLIDRSRFRQRWLVTGDDRLCPRCAPMSGKLVILGGRFSETERGVLPSERVTVAGDTVQHPPLHPRCRCTLVADFA